ncbi:hypothetical protein N474_18635 [Pseudoalteromonas luteoviolacea CPMOR-2]|uniref:Uncharacterized protein n=1 Tax=Pseudoalteromonas luteoviolacea DSM 6061 TaxID=1365250 RepID=A0A167DAC8_9GAMM|nr:hypothetical protein [Pseudoalteromonas luteoviolacea]KZN48607.1 hypothetical protein N475_06145 [Pseudoalteromonas luteoviolacea DSM 6061]KZN53970.1 hypothetical protein N474_18635 [Pseudoalteromonas luteoviolacea CPMOR-2]
MIKIRVKISGPRPPFYALSNELWPGQDIDSDGDSESPGSDSWTELTLINRSDETLRVDIDPESLDPLVLIVKSETKELAEYAENFLVSNCASEVISHV